MSNLDTPLTKAARRDMNDLSVHEHEREWVVPADLCETFERDCMTMALRLYAEDPDTFSPETRKCLDRWRPQVEALLNGKTHV